MLIITINNFKISNKATSNPLVKGSLAILRKSINDIEGMSLKNKELTIDIEKIVKVYCTDTYGIKLEKLDISTLTTKNGVLELLKEDFMKSNNQETLNEARELNNKSGHQLLQYIEQLGYIVKGCSCNPENCKVMKNC